MSWRIQLRADAGTFELDATIEGSRRPVALVGTNGSGKTTLLRMIAGALRPRDGLILVGDAVLYDSRSGIDRPSEQRHLGYVPQGYGLFPHLNVFDNVGFGLARLGPSTNRADRRDTILNMMQDLDIAHLAMRLPGTLSGGEQQRVALARALVTEPCMLLLDEPLAALDASNKRSVRSFLAQRLAAAQRPAIVVTHDLRDVLSLNASICVLDRGKIIQRGEVESLRNAPANDFVAEFLAL